MESPSKISFSAASETLKLKSIKDIRPLLYRESLARDLLLLQQVALQCLLGCRDHPQRETY
jgi:hypothetical protein